MKSYFPYNDRLNRSQRSKVIYNLKLVAGTVTNFTLAEQNKDSMTEKQNLSRPSLKVTIHPPLQVMPVKTTGNNIKWYHFDILASGKTDFHCKIKETLFIQERSLPLMPRSVYIPLINREWGHYREISDRGLDVLTERQRGQYIKAEVWDFPVMTERTRLISCLLYGLLALEKKNRKRFPISVCARERSFEAMFTEQRKPWPCDRNQKGQ